MKARCNRNRGPRLFPARSIRRHLLRLLPSDLPTLNSEGRPVMVGLFASADSAFSCLRVIAFSIGRACTAPGYRRSRASNVCFLEPRTTVPSDILITRTPVASGWRPNSIRCDVHLGASSILSSFAIVVAGDRSLPHPVAAPLDHAGEPKLCGLVSVRIHDGRCALFFPSPAERN